jgi:hypothetical protein
MLVYLAGSFPKKRSTETAPITALILTPRARQTLTSRRVSANSRFLTNCYLESADFDRLSAKKAVRRFDRGDARSERASERPIVGGAPEEID